MNGLTDQIKRRGTGSIDMTSRTLHHADLLVCTLEGYEGNLADEIASASALPVQFAELPAVAPEEFERLFSWFIS